MSQNKAPETLGGGRYVLLELAGVGSTSEVWRAEQTGPAGFRQEVAVKRMLDGLAGSQVHRARFVREAKVLAQIHHPNVVHVVDFGEDDQGLYLVTEWVEGLSVREVRDLCAAYGVMTSPVLMAAIGVEVLRALDAAHRNTERDARGEWVEAPVVHRDLSPSNVLLSVQGFVKLADFGAARGLDDLGLTPASDQLLKLGYSAPEVVMGAPHTPCADVYGCGVMLWEAIAGRSLWGKTSPGEVIRALSRGACAPAIQSVLPDIPMGLAAAINRATAPRPQERFATAAAFAQALGEVLRMIPERADGARLATEVINAMGMQRKLREQTRAKLSPPEVTPPEESRQTLELIGIFPQDRTPPVPLAVKPKALAAPLPSGPMPEASEPTEGEGEP